MRLRIEGIFDRESVLGCGDVVLRGHFLVFGICAQVGLKASLLWYWDMSIALLHVMDIRVGGRERSGTYSRCRSRLRDRFVSRSFGLGTL
jgi:hypothetical protein